MTTHNAKDLLSLQGDKLNRKIRDLLRTDKSTWWSDSSIIKFNDLSQEEKDSYFNDGMALFPEIFGSDYDRFTPWLIYHCYVWCGNVRDLFSAGGVVRLENELWVSAVMNRAYQNADKIKQRILNMTDEEMTTYWKCALLKNNNDKISKWLDLVNTNLKVSTSLLLENKKLLNFNGMSDKRICDEIATDYISILRDKIMNSSEG